MTKKLLLQIIRSYPMYFFAPILITVLHAAIEGAGLGLLIPIIEGLQSPEAIIPSHPISIFLADMLAKINISFSLPSIFVLGMSMFLIQSLLDYSRIVLSSRIVDKVQGDIRIELYSAYLKAELSYVNSKRIGDLVNSVVLEAHRGTVAFKSLIDVFVSASLVLAYVLVAFLISWKLTLLTMILVIPFAYLTRKRRLIRQKGKDISRANEEFQSATVEYLLGLREIKIFGLVDHILQKFSLVARNVSMQERLQEVLYARFATIYQLVGLSFLFILAYVGYSMQSSLPAMAAFLAVMYRLSPLSTALQKNRDKYLGLLPSFDLISRLQEEVNTSMLDRDGYENKFAIETISSGIQFEDICFSYDDKLKVLQDVNVHVENGKTTAIVGASGAGKSTFVDLAVRFYDPTQGRILVDGRDLKMLDIPSWRGMMGYVSQEPFLFNDTVANNISIGDLGASDDDIARAAQRANAHEFVKELPQGYNTLIGDRGVMLSGGQRQRIALARAILRNPSILILDEATSDLDTKSEKLIQAALTEMSRDRTVIIIAHRLSTVENADKIIVLEEGCVVEAGKHRDLLEMKGKYAEFYGIQFGKR
jgi:ATP-binding cassette, subfamily B, bacterial MsbA